VKVILIKDLGKLGKEGEAVEVKDGYARNYLIPQGMALQAIDKNFKKFQEVKSAKAKLREREKEKSLTLKTQLEKISLTIPAEAKDNEEIYGSINELQIVKLLKQEGVDIEKDKIIIESPIKKLGVYNIKINISSEICAVVRVWIVKK
jgi:large subunit ribosomal protein L9